MSEHDDEQALLHSPQRERQAREEGRVPLGKDVVGVAAMACGAMALVAVARPLRDQLVTLFSTAIDGAAEASFLTLPSRLWGPALLALAPCAAAALGAAVVTLAQTQGGFWPHLAAPDATRLFQANRLTRIVSKEVLLDLLLATAKVAAVGFVAYTTLRADFLTLASQLGAPSLTQLELVFAPLAKLAVKALTMMAVLAGLELALTRRRFRKQMMVTRDEARREHKEEEGDPLLRSRRKRRHRELLRAQVKAEVPKADAVVVNPVHVAVAIRYRKHESAAPRVVAKGKGKLAEVIRDLARANGVPIVEDVTLARLLYKKVKVGRQVPADTYRAVAAILAFVYRLTGRASQGAAR